MNDNSMTKVGAVCSILAGCIFAVSGLVFIAFQAGRFDWNSIGSISQHLSTVPLASETWLIVNWGATLASLLSIAGVLALAEVMRPAHPGLVSWLSVLAMIGYAVIAVTNVADYYQINRLALGYSQLDRSAQQAVNLVGVGSLDPLLNLRFVTLGPWFLTIGWLSLKSRQFPGAIGYLGVIAGIVGVLIFVASLVELEPVVLVAAVLAVVVHPVWLIATGYYLHLLGRKDPSGDDTV